MKGRLTEGGDNWLEAQWDILAARIKNFAPAQIQQWSTELEVWIPTKEEMKENRKKGLKNWNKWGDFRVKYVNKATSRNGNSFQNNGEQMQVSISI